MELSVTTNPPGALVLGFGVAAVAGALVGLEREPRGQASGSVFAGIRTFTLFSLFGALCSLLALGWGWAIPALGLGALAALLGLAYRSGQKPYLQHELQHKSNERNEAYQVEHPWGALLDEWLNPTEHFSKWVENHEEDWDKGAPVQFDTRQALIGCGARDQKGLQKQDEMTMAELLKKRSYVKLRKSTSIADQQT